MHVSNSNSTVDRYLFMGLGNKIRNQYLMGFGKIWRVQVRRRRRRNRSIFFDFELELGVGEDIVVGHFKDCLVLGNLGHYMIILLKNIS